MACEEGPLHSGFSNRPSSPTRISCGQREEFVHLLGISGCQADRCTHANLVHYKPAVLNVRGTVTRRSKHPDCAGHTAPLLVPVQCQSPLGAVPVATWEPCPGRRSTKVSPEQLGPVVRWQQLRNFSLQSRSWVGGKEQRGCVDRCGVQGKQEKKREKTGPRDSDNPVSVAVTHWQGVVQGS